MLAALSVAVLGAAAVGAVAFTRGSNVDARISAAEGYRVTGCRDLPSLEALAREVGDPGATAYACSGGLGVVIEPDGAISDFDAPSVTSSASTSPSQPPVLTATFLDMRISQQLKKNYDFAPKVIDCGRSTDIASGTNVPCKITVRGGDLKLFTATVTGSGTAFSVLVSVGGASATTSGSTTTTTTTSSVSTSKSGTTATSTSPPATTLGPSGSCGRFTAVGNTITVRGLPACRVPRR